MTAPNSPVVGQGSIIACVNCSRLKIRCDRQVPCRACIDKNVHCKVRRSRRTDTTARQKEHRRHAASRSSNEAQQSNHGGETEVSQAVPDQLDLPWSTRQSTGHIMGGFFGEIDFSKDVDTNGIDLSGGLDSRAFTLSPLTTPTFQEAPIQGVDWLPPQDVHGLGFDNGLRQMSNMQPRFPFMKNIPMSRDIPGMLDNTSMGGPLMTNDAAFSMMDVDALHMKAPSIGSTPSLPAPSHSLPGLVNSLSSSASPTRPQTPARSSRGSLNFPTSAPASIDYDMVGFQNLYDDDVVKVAQESWPSYRCNKPNHPTVGIKTTKLHLHGLAETLGSQAIWAHYARHADHIDPRFASNLQCEPVTTQTRDKLSSILQTMFHHTLRVHGISQTASSAPTSHGFFTSALDMSASGQTTYVVLPPVDIVEKLLRAYAHRFEHTYPSICAGRVRPNGLLNAPNPWVPALLVLLMVAAGAIGSPQKTLFFFTNGMIEVCRVSFFRAIDNDPNLRSDPLMLRCALMLVVLGAWSGDKCQMDGVMGSAAVHASMVLQSGLCDYRDQTIQLPEARANPEGAWGAYMECECRNRVVYSWVMVDLELSLFNDTVPLIPINALNVAMPDNEVLWQASDAGSWLRSLETLSPNGRPYPTMASLGEYFRAFTRCETDHIARPSQFRLRLLLHPIQAMVCHIRHYLGYFDHDGEGRKGLRMAMGSTMWGQLGHVQGLLKQWWTIYRQLDGGDSQNDLQTRINSILYHMISLNVVIPFARIENLAREGNDFTTLGPLLRNCIDDIEEALFHAGQALRHLQSLPVATRPTWWPAALYRIVLVLSACSLANTRPHWSAREATTPAERSAKDILINDASPDDGHIETFMKYKEGRPGLLTPGGTVLELANPGPVLTFGVEMLNHDLTSAFSIGIRDRLAELLARWSPVGV